MKILTEADLTFIDRNIVSKFRPKEIQLDVTLKTLKLLKEALNIIETKGWTKGEFNNIQGEVCAVGACVEAASNLRQIDSRGSAISSWPAVDTLTHVIDPKLETGSESIVANFNDKRGINRNHIKAKFQQAIEFMEAYKEYVLSSED